MHADAALARNDNVGKIGNREGGGGACENRARLCKLVENSEKFELHFQFFRNRLDDQFRVADCIFYVGGGRKQGERFAAEAPFEPSARDTFGEGLPDPGHRFFEPVRRDIFQHGFVPAKSRGICYSTPHRARANHGNGPHLHSLLVPAANRALIAAVSSYASSSNRRTIVSGESAPACETDWALWPAALIASPRDGVCSFPFCVRWGS